MNFGRREPLLASTLDARCKVDFPKVETKFCDFPFLFLDLSFASAVLDHRKFHSEKCRRFLHTSVQRRKMNE